MGINLIFMKYIFCIAFILLIMHNAFTQDENFPIIISTNSLDADLVGIPISLSQSEIKIPFHIRDTVIEIRSDNGTLVLNRKNKNISFLYEINGNNLKGELTIPNVRQIRYFAQIDVETFEKVIKLEEFYVPYRTGIWINKLEGEERINSYNVRFEEKKSGTPPQD